MIPEAGWVEIEPIKEETIAIDTHQRYEEMGKVIAIPLGSPYRVGQILYFDSYACRVTPEIKGKKHYFVSTFDNAIFAYAEAE